MSKLQIDFQTKGYEHLELSTQIVIKEALKRKIQVEVLDEEDNFLRLTKGEKIEYVRQSNQTSLDSYVVFHVLDNKKVQKQILNENGISVPQGEVHLNMDEAKKVTKNGRKKLA